jgi:hypothetical protein
MAKACRVLKSVIARRKMDDRIRQQLFADLWRDGMSSGEAPTKAAMGSKYLESGRRRISAWCGRRITPLSAMMILAPLRTHTKPALLGAGFRAATGQPTK